ncbi:MAG: hypothetical protein H0T69_03145 [Thermoleophilaceae bacterium]|nr:hypothetical protein [Thermoleophilaceae bacterium]
MPAGEARLGRAGLVVNVAAVAWLRFEAVNIAWPRASLAPPGAPFYQVWAATIVLALILEVGLASGSSEAVPKARRRLNWHASGRSAVW